MQLDHERLDVYSSALDLVVLVHLIVEALPGGHGDLRDQLRRSSTSVVLNIAEGAGEFSKPDKARFYRIARRSATECAAALDVAVRLELVTRVSCDAPRELLIRVVSMLVNMVRGLQR